MTFLFDPEIDETFDYKQYNQDPNLRAQFIEQKRHSKIKTRSTSALTHEAALKKAKESKFSKEHER